jgi:tRNA wybutosine-synthesizing protein 1
VCWKEKFYGIKSHRCAQVSVSLLNCENSCIHCWRNLAHTKPGYVKSKENPREILQGLVEKRKKLISGFGKSKNYKEALKPSLFTFSLTGEATNYPMLNEMIKEVRNWGCVSFLVTNGLNPKKLEELEKKKALPTQLTVSMNAPNEPLFQKWCNPKGKDAWLRFNRTLEIMKKLKGKTRRAVRLTLAKESKENKTDNMKPELIPQYAALIEKAMPDFIHVKGFMSVGHARERMEYSKVPWHKEVKSFAKKLKTEINKKMKSKKEKYRIIGEEKRSCVVMLSNLPKKDIKISKV